MSDIECTHDWVSNSSDNNHTYITISTLYSRSTCIQPCRRQLPGFSCQCHYCCRSATNQSIRDARQQNPWTSCLANELQAFRTTCRHNWHTAYYMTSYASTHLINNNNNNVTHKAQIHKGSKCAMSHITVKQKCFQSLPEGSGDMNRIPLLVPVLCITLSLAESRHSSSQSISSCSVTLHTFHSKDFQVKRALSWSLNLITSAPVVSLSPLWSAWT